MLWLVILFILAVCYWLRVQKNSEERVEEEVMRRKDTWKQAEEAKARAKEEEKRAKYIELVQRRIDKSD